jgi:hypothetical protein
MLQNLKIDFNISIKQKMMVSKTAKQMIDFCKSSAILKIDRTPGANRLLACECICMCSHIET